MRAVPRIQLRADRDARNKFWLGTLLWRFQRSFHELDLSEETSRSHTIQTLEEMSFHLKGFNSSATTFSIALCRVLKDPETRPDPGFHLGISFSLVGSPQPPIRKVMYPEHDETEVPFPLDYLKNKVNNIWTVKCVIHLIEYTYLEDQTAEEQHRVLKRWIEPKKPSNETLEDLAKLLNRNNLDEIFSGRQGRIFSVGKSQLLRRTLNYASEIRNKQSNNITPNTPLEIYLGYIAGNHLQGILKEECIQLFLKTHHYGLDFLRSECLEFMKQGFDLEFMIDVIGVMDLVNDERLNEMLNKFKLKLFDVWQSARWKDIERNYPLIGESILYTVKFQQEDGDQYNVSFMLTSETKNLGCVNIDVYSPPI